MPLARNPSNFIAIVFKQPHYPYPLPWAASSLPNTAMHDPSTIPAFHTAEPAHMIFGLPMPMARSLTSGAVMRAARQAEQGAAELDLSGAGD